MKNKINFTFISKDRKHLDKLKSDFTSNRDLNVESIDLQSVPGAIETLSVLGVTITILGGVVSQLIATWVYDLFKKKKNSADVELFIDGNRIKTKEQLFELVGVKKEKKSKKKKDEKKKK